MNLGVCYEAQLGSDEGFQMVVVDDKGPSVAISAAMRGARAAASAALSPALMRASTIAARSFRSLMMALRQSASIFVLLVSGRRAADWVTELPLSEVALAGGEREGDSCY